jgi:hypothetical protein
MKHRQVSRRTCSTTKSILRLLDLEHAKSASLIKTSRTRRISKLQEGTIERIAIGSNHVLMAPTPLRMDSQRARLA